MRAQGAPYRFRAGMILGLNYTANASPSFVRGIVGVRYDDGLTEEFVMTATALTTTRATFVIYPGTQQTLAPTQTFYKPGSVEYAQVVQGGSTKIAQRGQLYCSLVIADLASFESHTLCADYLFTGNSLTLGIVVPPGPAGGPGAMSFFALAAPAAGADYADLTVPTGAIQRLHMWRGQLVTAATAGNREVSTEYFDGTGVIGGCVASEVQTASLTEDYVAVKGGITSAGVSVSLAGGVIGIGLGDTFLIGAIGAAFRWKTFNIQGLDQWSVGRGALEEWVVPN